MSQNISTYLRSNFSLAAGATAVIDFRTDDINDMRIQFSQTYAATASTTGCNINLVPGWGGPDPLESPSTPIPNVLSILTAAASTPLTTVPQFANNYVAVTAANGYSTIVQPAPSTATPQTTTTTFYLNNTVMTWPRWIRIQCFNTDATHPTTLQFLADL